MRKVGGISLKEEVLALFRGPKDGNTNQLCEIIVRGILEDANLSEVSRGEVHAAILHDPCACRS